MPHQPVNPTPKKAFHLEALLSLETEIAALEEATGIETGYRRCGRIQPIREAQKRDRAHEHAQAAAENWPAQSPGGLAVRYAVLDAVPDATWLDPAQAPFGIIHDTLSARIEPRSLIRALAARARQLGVDIQENARVESLSADGSATFADGTRLTPGHIIVAAGVESFVLAAPLAGKALGGGVKGQAALLQTRQPVARDVPILFDGGVYVIAHESGLAAVGSTSEDDYTDATTTDEKLDAVIARATALCPVLAGARVVERWAGVRPKSGRDPLIGPLPGAPRVIACTGGYKITLGIAHRMADKALAHMGL